MLYGHWFIEQSQYDASSLIHVYIVRPKKIPKPTIQVKKNTLETYRKPQPPTSMNAFTDTNNITKNPTKCISVFSVRLLNTVRDTNHTAFSLYSLTHWGRVTHICVSKGTIIGSDNGLLPGHLISLITSNIISHHHGLQRELWGPW